MRKQAAVSATTINTNLSIALHEDERWHRTDVELLSGILGLIDVDLQEDDMVHRLRHLLDLRRDHLARTAPGGEEIDHDLKKLDRFSNKNLKMLFTNLWQACLIGLILL